MVWQCQGDCLRAPLLGVREKRATNADFSQAEETDPHSWAIFLSLGKRIATFSSSILPNLHKHILYDVHLMCLFIQFNAILHLSSPVDCEILEGTQNQSSACLRSHLLVLSLPNSRCYKCQLNKLANKSLRALAYCDCLLDLK